MKDFILRTIDPYIRLPNIGFDISERSVKYFALTQTPPFVIHTYGEIEIPEGIISNGEIKNEDSLADIFRLWLRKQPRSMRSAYITASVPEEKSFVRVIQLPQIKQDNLHQAIRWELEAHVPFPADQLIYDHEVIKPIEDHLTHLDVVITAFPKAIIESYVRVLKKAGFKLYALELESQAIIRSTIRDLEARHAYVVVDMGQNRTSFIIFSGSAIRFTTTIPLGGKTLEENIIKALKVSPEEAITLKKEVGLDRNAREGKMFSALVPAMAALADELHRAIFFYQDHAMHTHGAEVVISSVLLTGGDANLVGLDTYLSSALKIPVTLANPFASIEKKLAVYPPPLSPHTALAFTTAIGLSLRNASLFDIH